MVCVLLMYAPGLGMKSEEKDEWEKKNRKGGGGDRDDKKGGEAYGKGKRDGGRAEGEEGNSSIPFSSVS